MMDTKSFYPVFEDGQVLTSRRLNDIVDYLEPQTRLSRSQLVGIGVVCGLAIDWQPGRLTLSRGVAVTSEGYLIAEDEVVFDRARPYRLPVPSAPDATSEEKAAARYAFLFDGDTQRTAFELLPTDFIPSPGEAAPVALTDVFIADKTVLLFLERNREALKTCDVNDCSDKGSEINLTLRRLLVDRDTADQMLRDEAEIAGRPVDRANHPRLQLDPVDIDKINPAGEGVETLGDLYARIVETAGRATVATHVAMRQAFTAYRPLLGDRYPEDRFPDGPFPDHHFFNLWANWAENPVLGQYLHAGLHDIVRTYNEFVAQAARFDAECRPASGRFPLHVLLGDPGPRPVAFSEAPRTFPQHRSYEPLDVRGGPAPEAVPMTRRHHFVPSPVLDGGSDRLDEIRSLFARLVLLAQTHHTRGLLGASIRITPSRDGAAALGQRAIPFYYRFEETGDLFANWSWSSARTLHPDRIHAYRFTPDTPVDHPLRVRQDEDDFLRIEGVVGKPLGSAMNELIQQRRRLGLPFAIAPVYVGYGTGDRKLDEAARERALAALSKLILCRMRDLDVIFLMIMAGIFALMVWLVQTLGRLDATKTTKRKPRPSSSTGGRAAVDSGAEFPRFLAANTLRLDRETQIGLRNTSEKVRIDLNKGTTTRAELVRRLAGTQLKPVSVATIYDRVRDDRAGGELIDRVRVAAEDLEAEGDKDEIMEAVYPSVALIARAEEVMAVASAPSIADFDPDRFETAISGFSDAFDSYVANADTDEARVGREIARANKDILRRRDDVTSMARFGGDVIMNELRKRVESLFRDLMLDRFAQRHPSMEHKGGVAPGGTFVVLYGDREDFARGLVEAMRRSIPIADEVFAKALGAGSPEIESERIVKEVMASSKSQSDDVLDQFVVLGDFCLPYLCCENECGDRQVEERIGNGVGVISNFGTPRSTGAGAGRQPEPDVGTGTQPGNDGTGRQPGTGGAGRRRREEGIGTQPGTGETDSPSGTGTATGTPPPIDTGRRANNDTDSGAGTRTEIVTGGAGGTGVVTRPTSPTVRTGVLEGQVFSRRSNGREAPLNTANLVVTNTATNQSEETQLRESSFSLSLGAGKYEVQALFRDRKSNAETVSVQAGSVVSVRLVVL